MARRPLSLFAAVLVVLAIAAGVAWGWRAAVVFAFFAGIAFAVTLGASVGGDWLRESSHGRWERRDRS